MECKLDEDVDLRNLKRKIEAGVDVILTQVVFSATKFIEFVGKCRKIGISLDVPIIPGLYIPHDLIELDSILKITKVSMEKEIYENFKDLQDDPEAFQTLGLSVITSMIDMIRRDSPEFIRGFHFFTMNNFKMVQRLIQEVPFSGGEI